MARLSIAGSSRLLWVVGVCCLALVAGAAPPDAATPTVLRCELTGTVDAGSAAHLSRCVNTASEKGHQALLLRIDTPGGSLEATQAIVQEFLGSRVPILVWVGPGGARAGSAGVFLVLASHFAGMAEGTRIGAAHPVTLSGGDIGEGSSGSGTQLEAKIENDAAAFAAAIAKARGRNAEWAASAVRDSNSVPSTEAVRLGVVEALSSSEAQLLATADGKTFSVKDRPLTLHTRDAQVVDLDPTARERVLHALANPSLVFLLLMLGGLGVAIEMTHPGTILPGALGAAGLLLAMMALSALPVRAGAVVLLVLGVALIVAEFFVASGLLGAGGVILLVLGGLFLFDRFDPGWFTDHPLEVPARLVVPSALLVGAGSVWLLRRVAQARRLPPLLGAESLVGEQGKTLSAVNPTGGEVFVHGERWRAVADHPIRESERVVVRGSEGLTLHVQEVPS